MEQHQQQQPAGSMKALDVGSTAAPSRQHKSVPRWARMSIRMSVLVGVVALPSLLVKDESFKGLNKYRAFNILFTTLGTVVLPMWIPQLGTVVTAFTLILPIGLCGLWVAYGLFLACPNIIFMMMACVVVTGLTFFTLELLSMPVGLFSMFAIVFVAASNSFVQSPRMAHTMAVALSALLLVAAVLATWVCALVFPEYCVDEVFRHHHEGLEHLLHLAHYAMGLRPPRLVRRVASSSAHAVGRGSHWRAAFAAADELPTSLQALGGGLSMPALPREQSAAAQQQQQQGAGGAAGAAAGAAPAAAAGGAVNFAAKVERSWHRVAAAFRAGAQAQMGAKAEVVLAAAHHKRVVVPCVPLIPCSRGQLDEGALLALRHVGLDTSLSIIKLHTATNPLEPSTQALLHALLSAAEWDALRRSLLGALQELVDVFPMDYYPAARGPDRRHLRALQASLGALQAAWQRADLAGAAGNKGGQQQQQQQQPSHQQRDGHAAVTVAPAPGRAAAAFGGEDDPLQQLLPAGGPAAAVLARLNATDITRELQELIGLLEQLYDAVQAASQHLVSCKCC